MIGKLKLLLGIDVSDASKDSLLEFCIALVSEDVLNYCNIDSIPERLQTTVVAMCADCFRAAQYGKESFAGEEKSISEGDTTIQYVTAADVVAAASGASFLNPYRAQLNRFRRVVFP